MFLLLVLGTISSRSHLQSTSINFNPSFSCFSEHFFPPFRAAFFHSFAFHSKERAWDEVIKREKAQGAKARATAQAGREMKSLRKRRQKPWDNQKIHGIWGELENNERNVGTTVGQSEEHRENYEKIITRNLCTYPRYTWTKGRFESVELWNYRTAVWFSGHVSISEGKVIFGYSWEYWLYR